MRWPSWLRFGYPVGDDQCVVFEAGERCPYRVMDRIEFEDRVHAPGELRVCAWHGGRLREVMGLGQFDGGGS